MSLDAVAAPAEGSTVQVNLLFYTNQTRLLYIPTQFLRRPPNAPLKLPPSILSSTISTRSLFAYLTVPESLDDRFSTVSDNHLMLRDTFLATSTSGFLLSQFVRGSRPDNTLQEDQWTCSLPGGVGILTYH